MESRVRFAQEPRDAWGVPLGCISWFYRGAVHLRNRWYDKGIGVRRLPAPVVSVGNLTAGGTGKTPMVILLSDLLKQKGAKVTVLSRGYGRSRTSSILQVSEGNGSKVSVRAAGDEPYMMAQRLKGVSIWVGADRFRAGMAAWETNHCDVFILDDGFQHRALARDLDLVVARLPRPWGNNKLIPAGPLREPVSSLKRAQLLVFTGEPDGGSQIQYSEATKPIPSIGAFLRAKNLRVMGGQQTYPVEFLRGKKAALVCAIGDPHGLGNMVRALGAELGPCLFFPDHHWYTPHDASCIKSLVGEVDLIVTTEKDIWKIRETGLDVPLLMALEVDLEVQGMGSLEALLERLMV